MLKFKVNIINDSDNNELIDIKVGKFKDPNDFYYSCFVYPENKDYLIGHLNAALNSLMGSMIKDGYIKSISNGAN